MDKWNALIFFYVFVNDLLSHLSAFHVRPYERPNPYLSPRHKISYVKTNGISNQTYLWKLKFNWRVLHVIMLKLLLYTHLKNKSVGWQLPKKLSNGKYPSSLRIGYFAYGRLMIAYCKRLQSNLFSKLFIWIWINTYRRLELNLYSMHHTIHQIKSKISHRYTLYIYTIEYIFKTWQ